MEITEQKLDVEKDPLLGERINNNKQTNMKIEGKENEAHLQKEGSGGNGGGSYAEKRCILTQLSTHSTLEMEMQINVDMARGKTGRKVQVWGEDTRYMDRHIYFPPQIPLLFVFCFQIVACFFTTLNPWGTLLPLVLWACLP
jgi:sulfite reductase alpha subunit-like flavoprotein